MTHESNNKKQDIILNEDKLCKHFNGLNLRSAHLWVLEVLNDV